MKRHFVALIGLLTATSATAFAQDIPLAPAVKDSGTLTIANSLSYPPFEYTDENGKASGLDIDLAQAVADLLKVKLQIENVPFGNQIPGLASARFQVAWASFSVTKERLAQVDFVTFMSAGTVAVAKPENKDKFSQRTALCGATVAVQGGSAADFSADQLSKECVAAGSPALDKQIYPEHDPVVQAVLTGRAQAYLDDSTSAGYFETTTKGQLVISGESFYPTPLGVAVAKGDKAAADMMHAALTALMKNGTYESVLKKYNMQTSAATESIVYTDPSQVSH